jgi:MFS family permease
LEKPPQPAQTKVLKRAAFLSLGATSIEFYDFFIFGTAAALVFPKIFFPPGVSPLVALIYSFSAFAVGFFARPIGAAIFGNYGDRVGRKRMLVTALLMMGGATTLIGLLPSHHVIGNMAPLLLVLLRFVQGLALGGQWGGAVLIILENAPDNRRGWYGSFAQVGAPIGTILANLAFLGTSALLSPDDFLVWGWRIPFVASVLLIGISVFIHLTMEETDTFKEFKALEERRFSLRAEELSRAERIDLAQAVSILKAESGKAPALEVLRQYPRQILLAAGTFVGMQASYYVLVSFSLAYGSDPAGAALSTNVMLGAVLIGAVAMMVGVFWGGALSDKIGRRKVIAAATLLLSGWVFAIFPLIDTGNFWAAVLGIGIGQLLNGLIFGPLAPLYTESFATKVRYSGMSLAYQLGTLVGGALAPLIATSIHAKFGSSIGVSAYVSALCLVSFVSALLIKESYRAEIRAPVDRVARTPAE